MRFENEQEAEDLAGVLGIGKCPKCGIVTGDPEGHCGGK